MCWSLKGAGASRVFEYKAIPNEVARRLVKKIRRPVSPGEDRKEPQP